MQLNAPAVFYNERTEEYHTVYNYHIIQEPPIYWSSNYRDHSSGVAIMKTGCQFVDEENIICGPLIVKDNIHKVIISSDEWILLSIGDAVFYNLLPEPDENYIEEWRKLMKE